MRLASIGVSCVFVLCGFAVCHGQPAAQQIRRLQGSVTRPNSGVQHPDLETAWAEYDKRIDAAATRVKEIIDREVNAFAADGNLDSADKWDQARQQFEKQGQMPEGLPSRKALRGEPSAEQVVREVKDGITQAQARLVEAYTAVEKAVTKQHDLQKAKQIRAEREAITPIGDKGAAAAPVSLVIDASNYISATPNAAPNRDGTGVAMRKSPKWDNLTIPADSTLLWDVRLPQKGNFFIHVLYASGEARPCDVVLNGKVVAGRKLGDNTGGFMRRHLKWETLGPVAFEAKNDFVIDPQTHGPHLGQIKISTDPNP